MKKSASTGAICVVVSAGLLLTFAGLTAYLYVQTRQRHVLWLGLLLAGAALGWVLVLIVLLRHRLLAFTGELCSALDAMMDGNGKPQKTPDEETLFARLHNRLTRLYEVTEENRRRVDEERQELQSLVTDISHQVKTPVSNLKMLTDTLLERPVSAEERTEFLQGMRSQTEKLDFLFGAMVKSSRLETGMIRLERREARFYDTLAQALSGIVYSAEQKRIAVTVACDEGLRLCHDSKWTAEALFNLLDNAVKYTPQGGEIAVAVEEWELYVKIAVRDNGRGIPEERQAAVFRRFYREEDVRATAGVGIGLYLAREIITLQGGYIKLTSAAGKGSTFSVFLPKR